MPNKGKRIASAPRNPKKRNSHSFKPGNVVGAGNQNKVGVPAYDAEELAAKTIDKGMVTRYLTINSHLTIPQLKAKLKDEKNPPSVLEAMIMRGMLVAYITGDVYKIDFFLSRLIGPVPKEVKFTKVDPYEGKTLAELKAMKEELSQANQQTLRLLEQTPRVQQQERQVIELTNGEYSSESNSGN